MQHEQMADCHHTPSLLFFDWMLLRHRINGKQHSFVATNYYKYTSQTRPSIQTVQSTMTARNQLSKQDTDGTCHMPSSIILLLKRKGTVFGSQINAHCITCAKNLSRFGQLIIHFDNGRIGN